MSIFIRTVLCKTSQFNAFHVFCSDFWSAHMSMFILSKQYWLHRVTRNKVWWIRW